MRPSPRWLATVVVAGLTVVACGNDRELPHVQGERSRMDRFMSWYIGKLHLAAQNDAALSIVFLKVVNMMAPMPYLIHPAVMLRVLAGNIARKLSAKPKAGPAIPAFTKG